jgi:hypothetical protein
MQFSPPHIISFLLGPNVLLSTMFLNTLNLYFSFKERDYVSHPCKTTAKIIVLYILIDVFLDGKREDKNSELDGRKNSPNLICSYFLIF